LQEQKDKDALLKQQQELLRVAQEQKVSKGLSPTAVMWCLLWTKWHKDNIFVGRDSVVGVAICYGLDSPGIKSRWG
jgi:hypothetical protein